MKHQGLIVGSILIVSFAMVLLVAAPAIFDRIYAKKVYDPYDLYREEIPKLDAILSSEIASDDVWSKTSIRDILKKTFCRQWIRTQHDPFPPYEWGQSTFYIGVAAAYRATGDRIYLDQATRWAEQNRWELGPVLKEPNHHACGQVYLELYLEERDEERLRSVKHTVDRLIERPERGRKVWKACDALFMSPPTMARLGAVTGKEDYFNYMDSLWWDLTEFHYDDEAKLFYRDHRFGTSKVFWSRGNGWVMAGLVRVLQYLPKEHPKYENYVTLFRDMAKSIASLQRDDGFWGSDLLNKRYPESSGTALFCYAFAYGVNTDLLEREVYLPIIKASWESVVSCLHPDGSLGFVQGAADRPGETSFESTRDYGVGAMLLAGSEVYQLTNGPHTTR